MGLGEELQDRMIKDGLIKDPKIIARQEQEQEELIKKEIAEANKKAQEEQIKIYGQILPTNLIGKTTEIIQALEQQEQEENKKADIAKIAMKLAQRSGFSYAVREFLKEQPIYYDKSMLWWMWNKKNTAWELTDEIEILNLITAWANLFGDSNIKYRKEILEAFKQEGRKVRPKELPKEFIQFNNKIFNIKTKEIMNASSEYFCVNPIPWDIGATEETPTLDALFEQWVGKDNVKQLYEILAYCCYPDYPLHHIFCMVGSGRNGKSKYLGVGETFLGIRNLCATELDTLLNNRFESFKLYKKLACFMGETNFNKISNTSLLKKLSGQDLIGFEAKNKTPFDDKNYAKLIISSNGLPPSDDNSDGFYRRWIIIRFPNEFQEGKDILQTIPLEEYNNLARKVCNILPELLDRGLFTNQGTIEERKQRYIENSNPLEQFIKEECIVGEQEHIRYMTLFGVYNRWLTHKKMREIKGKEFTRSLLSEGYEKRDTRFITDGVEEKGIMVIGLSLRNNGFLTNYVQNR